LRGRNFFPHREGEEAEARRAESVVGFFGRGSEPLPIPARGSGGEL